MKTTKFILIINLILISSICYGQIQNRYWYFGDGAGLDFGPSLDNPIVISGFSSRNLEGVASISDSDGNFLFYTDGQEVRDQSLIQIANNLNGNNSSSQSGIIVPAPCACDSLFYVFTIDYGGTQGNNNIGMALQYATAGINKNGNIIVSNPIGIAENTFERLTAIPHDNGTDYWILATFSNTRNFSINLLTCDGLVPYNSTGLQSISDMPGTFGNSFGYLKGSRNGQYIAAALGIGNGVNLYNFNPTTGDVSFIRNYPDDLGDAYGVEFSPNNQYLFISKIGFTPQEGRVSQFDINSGNPLIPINQQDLPNPDGRYAGGALQLGPDNIIYIADDNSQNLDAILDPNLSTWNYMPDYITFDSGTVKLGLPNLITQFNECMPDITMDTTMVTGCCDSLDNLIINGNFENDNTGIETDYTITTIGLIVPILDTDGNGSGTGAADGDADAVEGAEGPTGPFTNYNLLPGEIALVNTSDASLVCDNWEVDDHTTNCDGVGNFLVVNGETGQTTNTTNIIWGQTIEGLDTSDTYKFCASFKHLEQCCFDVVPEIDIIINGIVENTITINGSVGTDSCSWQEYSYSFSPDNSTVTIEFALNETTLGDGNDLAIDDIILGKLPPAPIYFNITDNRPKGPNLLVNADPLPAMESCQYEWTVGRVTDITSISPFTFTSDPLSVVIGGSSSSYWNTLGHTFPGYDGTGTLSDPLLDGQFEANEIYFVKLDIFNCNCFADTSMFRVTSLGYNRLGGVSEELTLSQTSLEMLEEIKNAYHNGTISQLPTSTTIDQSSLLYNQIDKVSLAQNQPNPFDNTTTINYFLPETTQSAKLRITGIDGKLLQTIQLNKTGQGQITINTSQYVEGIYFYSLMIDDRVMETKRMVLTR